VLSAVSGNHFEIHSHFKTVYRVRSAVRYGAENEKSQAYIQKVGLDPLSDRLGSLIRAGVVFWMAEDLSNTGVGKFPINILSGAIGAAAGRPMCTCSLGTAARIWHANPRTYLCRLELGQTGLGVQQ
jgi:hypothetical protein